MRNLVSVIIVLITLASCGPSAEEMAAIQRRRDDSISRVAQQKAIVKMELKQNIAKLKDVLENLNADLVAATDGMKNIQEFHLFRTQKEREEQLRSQTLKIQKLNDRIQATSQEISEKQIAINSN